MTYASQKMRMFKNFDEVQLCWKRSDGRMKNYQSALDARAWCDSREDRKQYILDLVKRGDGKVCKDLRKFGTDINPTQTTKFQKPKKPTTLGTEETKLVGVLANSTEVIFE